jgi:hypothetical protein
MGVPVFHGCIDRSLFLANLREQEHDLQMAPGVPTALGSASHPGVRSRAA